MNFVTLIVLSLALLIGASAQQCGRQARGRRCRDNLCCSQYGFCGTTSQYCSLGCQSQCRRLTSNNTSTSTSTIRGEGGSGVSNLISPATYDRMLKYRNDGLCPSHGLHKHDAFIAASKAFSGFGTTGDVVTRKRELAAFLAQISHETTGRWASGYCKGPIRLTHNYNYAQASKAIGADLINNPELVATDPVVSFKTAIWFWMTPQSSKPSSHDVILGKWNPSSADRSAGRVPGYGVVTNIINGGHECGKGQNDKVARRIGFYKRYCEILSVSPGNNLDCYNQKPFA